MLNYNYLLYILYILKAVILFLLDQNVIAYIYTYTVEAR